MSSPQPEFVSEREYLEQERKSEFRSEYIAGRVFARSGASRRHNLITGNLNREISLQLRNRPREVYASAMRVKIPAAKIYTYPDIVALCGEPQLEDATLDTLLNPAVIIEVLSDSTEAYDRGAKFEHYRRIESLREYVLVAQNKIHVELYRRQNSLWVLSDVDDTLLIPSIDCSVNVAAIYEKVELTIPD